VPEDQHAVWLSELEDDDDGDEKRRRYLDELRMDNYPD